MQVPERFREYAFKRGVYAALEPSVLRILLHEGTIPAGIDTDTLMNPTDYITQCFYTSATDEIIASADGSMIEVKGDWSGFVSSAREGTATWFSVRRTNALDTDYTGVTLYGTVTATGGGGDLELPVPALVTPDTVDIASIFVRLSSAGIAITSEGTLG